MKKERTGEYGRLAFRYLWQVEKYEKERETYNHREDIAFLRDRIAKNGKVVCM